MLRRGYHGIQDMYNYFNEIHVWGHPYNAVAVPDRLGMGRNALYIWFIFFKLGTVHFFLVGEGLFFNILN